MTELLLPRRGMKALEIGTGSGYQAAILAHTGCRVLTIEIFDKLAASARDRLLLEKDAEGRVSTRDLGPVRFVPLLRGKR